MDADAPDWKNLYCGSCTLRVSGWLSLLSPVGRPHTHTHSNTHTLLSSIDHTDAANLLELEKLVYLPGGA